MHPFSALAGVNAIQAVTMSMGSSRQYVASWCQPM